MLIPSRGPHPSFRSTEVRRRWSGTRDAAGSPEASPDEGRLVLIPPGDSHNSDRPPACRWETGAGLERRSTPRRRSRRRPGDGVGGVGRTVRSRWASPFPPQSRGPLDAHTIKRPSPFSALLSPPCRSRRCRGKSPRETQHTVHVPDTSLTLTRVGPARAARRGRRLRRRRWSWPPGRAPPGSQADDVVPGARPCSSTASRTWTGCGPCWPAGRPTAAPSSRAAGRGAGDLRRRGPGRRRRALGHRPRRRGRPARRELDLVSAFCGFAPGFAYLSGLPGRAGRAAPRHAAPAGARRLGRRSPTAGAASTRPRRRAAGGCSAARPPTLWDPDAATSPALLAPGTRVGSCRHDARRLEVVDGRRADDRPGPRPGRPGPPRRARAPARSTGRRPTSPTGWSATGPTRPCSR